MPNWRKLIQSGSDAELASLFIFKSGSTDDRLLVVSGTNGEMMAVSDDNSGTLLRVNDVSGINMFSVSSSGHLVAPQLTFDDDAPFTLGYESGSGLITYRSSSNALSASYATTASHAIFSLSSIDSQDLIVGVKNDFGATIQKGTPVYAKGVLGENILVAPASASDSTKMPAIAVLNETLTNNSSGDALISGRIKNVNTLGFTAGETVYVGPNGGYTQVKPTGSALIQNLGIVGKVNETEGEGVVIGAGRSNDVPNILPDYIFLGSSGNTLQVPLADALTGSLPSGVVSGSSQTVSNLVNQDVDLGTGDLTATEATVTNFTINDTLTAPTITGSLLRLSEDGTGLRLTNVGAFESSSGFHIFANDNMRFSTNGSGTGNEVLRLEKTSKDAIFANNISASGYVSGSNIVNQTGDFVNNEFLVAVGQNGVTSSDALAVDSSGNLGIGTANPTVRLHMVGEDAQTSQILMEQYNQTQDAPDIRTRRYRGTPTSASGVRVGDYLFRFNVEGYQGGSTTTYGSMQFDVDTTDKNALDWTLQTRDTSGTNADRLTINKHGNAEFSGSVSASIFSGSFVGDGSGLTGVTAGALTIVNDTFSGNNSTTQYSVTNTIASENNLQIYIDGVYQSKNNYSTSGTTITFSTAPPIGTNNIEVNHFVSLNGDPDLDADIFSGNSSTTDFTLTTSPISKNFLQIYINGVYQAKSTYSVSGTTLSFTTAPPTGTNNIEVININLS